jgi:hypothetical protein
MMTVRAFDQSLPCALPKAPEAHVISFIVEATLPARAAEIYRDGVGIGNTRHVATSFPDFCWRLANGSTIATALELRLPRNEASELGDLTWLLPSKFADDLLEVLHALNDDLLHGALQESWMYGPLVF